MGGVPVSETGPAVGVPSGPLQAVAVLSMFFAEHERAGLVLPDGWFGRPYATMLELTTLDLGDDAGVLVLDGRHTLTVAGPVAATTTDSGVELTGFGLATWEWRDYGDDAVHREEYRDGTVAFIAA